MFPSLIERPFFDHDPDRTAPIDRGRYLPQPSIGSVVIPALDPLGPGLSPTTRKTFGHNVIITLQQPAQFIIGASTTI